jgi:hypothetical protein
VKELYHDRMGIPFDQHTLWLPSSTSNFPTPPLPGQSEGKRILAAWRANWAGTPCWWCGGKTTANFGKEKGELHHLRTGIESAYTYTWLCAGCHRIGGDAVKAESLGRLLWLKWFFDKENTFWYGIAIRLRRRLPDLITTL